MELFVLVLTLTFSSLYIIPLLSPPSNSASSNLQVATINSFMEGLEPKMVVRSDRLKRDVADCGDNNQNGYVEQEKKKKGVVSCAGKKGGGGNNNSMRCCQAEKCNADLHEAKQYHRRHRVCEYHAKAQVVLVDGVRQRFYQQCSRFHELAEFGDTKRSCCRRLAGHNERRRKNSDQSQEERVKPQQRDRAPSIEGHCLCQADERGRTQITIQENAAYKHFQMR